MHEWRVSYVEYAIDAGVDVTTLHWQCSKVDGGFTGSSYGTVTAEGHYADKPTIEAVPKATWETIAKAALGVEEVQSIEDGIDAQIAEQVTPTHGGFTPL